MFRNYFKTAFRNFRKNKFYASLNVAGLAIGIAACLLIMLYVFNELSYDKYHVNANRIYRINNEIKFGSIHLDLAQTPALLGTEAVKQLPGVEQYTRLRRQGGFLVKKGDTNLREDAVVYADSTLFKVFSLPMISGDPETALKEPRSMVISETIARKYFNRTDVAGQSLLINDTANYKVTGVIRDIPQNSHFNFDFFLALAESKRSRDPEWLSQNFNTYLLLEKGVDADKLEQQVDAMLNRLIDPELKSSLGIDRDEFTKQGNFSKCTLTPLTAIHLHSDRPGEIAASGSIQYVRIFSLIALFILIIAYVNFMNLFTARSSNRAKEVGVRKVLGSLRKNLVLQFLAESLLISYMALFIAIVIASLALPYFNQLSGMNISMSSLFRPSVIVAFLCATTIAGFLAGSYPALLLSAFRPIEVLKGKIAKGFRGSWLRNALVIFQFSISIILIAGTIVIYRQVAYIQKKDIGFNRQQVMVLYNTNALKGSAPAFKNELMKMSGVDNVTMTGYLPVNGYRNAKTFLTSPAMDPKNAVGMQSWFVDENYIPTLGIRLKEGRNFSRQFLTDTMGIIINEAAAGLLGTNGLLNKIIYNRPDDNNKKVDEYHIVGVIKNFHFSSLRDVVTPMCLILGKENSSMAIRLNTTDISPLISQIKNRWQATAAGQPFSYSFMDEDFNRLYFEDQRTAQILMIFAALAILIACMGLFALVAFAAEQRIKEIGIRKVLGASVINIVGMLSRDFLKLVIIAALLSFPIAWWAMDKWLQDFAYRISIGWWVFVIAGSLALFIAFITIGFQAVKAGIANPVQSLRTE